MGSLARVLEYELQRQFNGFPSDSEIEEIVSIARRYLDEGETLRARIRTVAKARCDEATNLPDILKGYVIGQGHRSPEKNVTAP
jgi:pyridoxine/pyridoxamine 5'-phosphate oxidase